MGIGQCNAEAEFSEGRGGGCGFAAEYHVGGGLEVDGLTMTRRGSWLEEGLVLDGFACARVLGKGREEGVHGRTEGSLAGDVFDTLVGKGLCRL